MSLSSPSPSRFAKTSYCSVRDWTRFLRHRIKKYPDSPVHTLTDSLRIYFFPLWRAYLFFYGFASEFAVYVWTVAVSATKKLRIRKYPYTCGRGLDVLKKCQNKFDCLFNEMLLIKQLRPCLNVQSDSNRAKVFV